MPFGTGAPAQNSSAGSTPIATYVLSGGTSEADLRARIKESPHSLLPVTDGSPDNIVGVLESADLFTATSVADVVAAHAELVRHDEIKAYATALLGHSEGALLVLAAAPAITRHPPHAMVLMGAPGRPLGEVLRAQIERTAPPGLVGYALAYYRDFVRPQKVYHHRRPRYASYG